MSSGATEKDYFGGIDIGGTKLCAIVTDGKGRIKGRSRKKTRPERGFEWVVERAAGTLFEACEASGVKPEQLRAVGVGSPSPILEDGTAVYAPNLGWNNMPLTAKFRDHFKTPVFAENDCNAGTLGEYVFGAGKGAKTLFGFFMGTGLGTGLVYHGELIRGENRMAAEGGHVIVQARGRRCACGHLGCLEAYASKVGMGRKFFEEIILNGRDSLLIEKAGGDYANVKGSVLQECWKAGDRVVKETLEEACFYLGVGVANMITLLGPDRVVVGGGVFEALGKELIEQVKKSARKHIVPEVSVKDTQIVLATLGDDSVALGAVACAMKRLENQP